MSTTKTIEHPGVGTGPCGEKVRDCTHRECAEMHRYAERKCIFCGHPIGFGVPFYLGDEIPDMAKIFRRHEAAHAGCSDPSPAQATL